MTVLKFVHFKRCQYNRNLIYMQYAVRWQSSCNPCVPECPPTPPCPPCPPPSPLCPPPPPPPMCPPHYCCPRTKYQVNWIYVNDVPPTTTLRDFFDRATQVWFWTELIRGKLSLYLLSLRVLSFNRSYMYQPKKDLY